MAMPRSHWGIPKDAVGSQVLIFIDNDAQTGKPDRNGKLYKSPVPAKWLFVQLTLAKILHRSCGFTP
jgi:hypothetical protein